MLANLTQIEPIMDLMNGREASLDRDNLNSQNSIFSIIENKAIARDEYKHNSMTDNIADNNRLRKENGFDDVNNYLKEEIRDSVHNKNRYKKVNAEDNPKDENEKINSIDELNLNSDVVKDQKRNYKKENEHLIQSIFNNTKNKNWAKKQLNRVSAYNSKEQKINIALHKLIAS